VEDHLHLAGHRTGKTGNVRGGLGFNTCRPGTDEGQGQGGENTEWDQKLHGTVRLGLCCNHPAQYQGR
jgi:hypothetical protein